ncbi:hypothetical protein ACN27F_30125 [Solwaraspora sp. WMMB335]|uniref:hypothetical protein n=1 Tax=Solwaraspora sp. WMMB335 TaxID=3404118 RepID=UPI003B93ACEB
MTRHVTYLLHAVGNSDLGAPAGRARLSAGQADAGELLARLEQRPDDDPQTRQILLLRTPEQTTGQVAPLAAALSALPTDTGATTIHLVLLCTPVVAPIADVIAHALNRQPDLYGVPVTAVTIVRSDNIIEREIACGVTRFLRSRADSTAGRVYTVWGSGSTQVILGALDAVITSGLPWSLIRIGPTVAPRHAVYDPTAGLPVDPVVPLLRRWRYHDLLRALADAGQLSLTAEQRRVVDAEADHFGQAYVVPNADRMRAVMAAALMRGDGSSGFAVRAYIVHRYQELREHDGSTLDLLHWAQQRNGRRIATLGKLIGTIDRERQDSAVLDAKRTASGEWLLSPIVRQLNEMGKDSSHELAPPQPAMLDALRRHLAEHDTAPAADLPAPSGLGPLPLVPGDTVCYLAILGWPDRDGGDYAIKQIADAVGQNRWRRIEKDVQTYLGGPVEVPVKLIILGTASGTFTHAQRVGEQLRAAGHTVVTASVAAVGLDSDHPAAFTEQAAVELLGQHVGPDTGAIVLIPTGPKEHVLTLLAAGQQTAAERDIPLFLRQLVNRDQNVLDAGTHRLPLRFGTDLAVLTAASHALDVAELDTAARLLGTLATGKQLSDRALRLSDALRHAGEPKGWPVTTVDAEDPAVRMVAERIEVWATLPGIDKDPATGMRAIIGACACAERSADNHAQTKTKIRNELTSMFDTRNQLPVTHGHGPFDTRALGDLILEHTGGAQHTVSGLLTAMANAARAAFGDRLGSGPRLADVLAELRDDVRRLRDT